MLSEQISIGGARVSGFGLAADPSMSFKPGDTGAINHLGESKTFDGVKITLVAAAPYSDPSTANPMDQVVQQSTSKAAVFGIAAGAATVLGGIVYLATRKPRRRRRR